VNVVLWVLQGLLAALYATAGVLKTTQPKDKLAARLPWTEDFSAATVKVIGSAELLGALGLILPAATGILPWLTPLAATGLAVVMLLAVLTHARRKEPQGIAFAFVLLVLAAFVAWARFGPYSL